MCCTGTEILQTQLLDQTPDGSSYLLPEKIPEVTTVKAQAKKDSTAQSGPQVKQMSWHSGGILAKSFIFLLFFKMGLTAALS
jgi:hypothetical protein